MTEAAATIAFELPPISRRHRGRPPWECLPALPNRARRHWAANAFSARRWRAAAFFSASAARVPGNRGLGAGLTIRMVRVRTSGPPADDDNATASMKAVRDGIADAIFGAGKGPANDGDPRIQWEVAQELGTRAGVRVEVRPRAAEEAERWI